MEPRPYHHGDLRAALIHEGLRLLEEKRGEEPSLREVARRAGVSATAVYRHFPDKQALMAALAQQGLQQLATVQNAASDSVGGGDEGFAATGRAYVRFALAHPALFRLIFTSPVLAAVREDGVLDSDAGALLYANAAAFAARAGGEAHARAIRAWSLVHGLAMLMLDGQIPADEALIDQLIRVQKQA
ncbi:TetR/AcrR family transcriptional regulator [Insolitispirillum peregrinum]|uniref:Transcriptional regulator, TetR family n=1 Tax=Insolitispirillum peregrinum TaxID=80876 RepID=A0A1N7P6K8_9PROT|nr:TetR/AcrR family transcriptional regulator [Insolitispirillum peregrinum]SIT06242.1 transcriptional regulator, TetR family [Insolitispirillum peregrinum]